MDRSFMKEKIPFKSIPPFPSVDRSRRFLSTAPFVRPFPVNPKPFNRTHVNPFFPPFFPAETIPFSRKITFPQKILQKKKN